MAQLQTVVGIVDAAVRLRLQEADPQVQLGGYIEVLVVLWERADEGGIVGAQEGVVGVGARVDEDGGQGESEGYDEENEQGIWLAGHLFVSEMGP